MSDEKTEEPTHKKLEDAKRQGQHAKSEDTAAALSMLAMTVMLSSAAAFALGHVAAIVSRVLDELPRVTGDAPVLPQLLAQLVDGLWACLPFIGVSMLVGLVGQAVQVGLNISFEAIELKFEKLNPAEGLKKLISMKSVIEFVKTVIKAIATVTVLWAVIKGLLPVLIGAAYTSPATIALLGWTAVIKLMGFATLIFLVIGPLDFGIQKYLFIKDQRMTKDEVKREHKESEGDPQLKGQRKQLAQEYATTAPKQAVPGATVVVTNPTHYAVALYYDAQRAPVPVVVAKGVDAEAAAIRQIAEEHQVPIVSEPPLARALFRLKLNEPVPRAQFEAVAAVLRWVALVRGAP